MQPEENFYEEEIAIEKLFSLAQETYQEAQARAAEENKGFVKTEFFRMEKVGTYRLRVLPLAPNSDGSIARKSYEHPIHQLLLEIQKPSTSNKPQFVYVTAPRATDAGYTTDIIDTYRKLAINEANERGDDKLAEKIGGGSFGGGLKYNYSHALYILDSSERAKGLQLLTLTHSQFKDLDDRKFKLWQKKLAKNPNYPCPISSISDAYIIEIEKKKNGAKTEYRIEIDNESEVDILSKEELTALMNAPRIPEIVSRYSRYIFEATLEFLRQCDRKYEMGILDKDEMKTAIDTLKAELPKEDTSSFSFDKRTKDAKENADSNSITLDYLLDKLDELEAQSLTDKTPEGQELRGMIRTYIEQENLQIRMTRSTSNQVLLKMIEDFQATPYTEGTITDEEQTTEAVPRPPRERQRR